MRDKVEGWEYTSATKQFVADPEKNKIMNMLIDKYAKLLRPIPESPDDNYISKFEEDKLNSPEGNLDILRIIHANQNKQRQLKEVNCIIEDPGEIILDEVEETCNSELSKIPERFSRSVSIPVSDAEQFLLEERAENDNRSKLPRHRRMESRSFDKSSLKKIMEIDLDKVGCKGGFKK